MDSPLLIMGREIDDRQGNRLAQPEFLKVPRLVDGEGDEEAPGVLLFNGIEREKPPRIQKRPVEEKIKDEVGSKPNGSVDPTNYPKAGNRHHGHGPV